MKRERALWSHPATSFRIAVVAFISTWLGLYLNKYTCIRLTEKLRGSFLFKIHLSVISFSAFLPKKSLSCAGAKKEDSLRSSVILLTI